MDKVEYKNGSIIYTRFYFNDKKFLGTLQFKEYCNNNKFLLYYECGTEDSLYIKENYYLNNEKMEEIFKNKVNIGTENYTYFLTKFSNVYIYINEFDQIHRIEYSKWLNDIKS